jgi:predicted transposase YbfD/YdcC
MAEGFPTQGGALKGNQSDLQEDMQTLFEAGMDSDFAGMQHAVYQTTETGHGRTDERTCHVIAIPTDHPQRTAWRDLQTLAVTVSRRVVGDQETWESRLYVSSHTPRAKFLAQAIRRHWSIENAQHWVLDVAFGEDARRQQDRHGATNLAAVRRLAISVLRRETQTSAAPRTNDCIVPSIRPTCSKCSTLPDLARRPCVNWKPQSTLFECSEDSPPKSHVSRYLVVADT